MRDIDVFEGLRHSCLFTCRLRLRLRVLLWRRVFFVFVGVVLTFRRRRERPTSFSTSPTRAMIYETIGRQNTRALSVWIFVLVVCFNSKKRHKTFDSHSPPYATPPHTHSRKKWSNFGHLYTIQSFGHKGLGGSGKYTHKTWDIFSLEERECGRWWGYTRRELCWLV